MPRLLMYTSDICPLMADDPAQLAAGLADIERTARRRNADLAVGGLLLVDQGRFVEILEGEAAALDRLMDSIEADSRHRNLQRLLDEPVHSRSLPHLGLEVIVLDEARQLSAEALQQLRDVCAGRQQPGRAGLDRWLTRLVSASGTRR